MRIGFVGTGTMGAPIARCLIAAGHELFVYDRRHEATAALRELGAHVDSVAMPEVAEAMDDQKRLLMVAAEALAVNGRLLEQHPDALDPIVASRLASGRALTATDYVEVSRRWAGLRRRVARTLADVDAVLAPVTMIPARPLSIIDATPETYAAHNAKYLRNNALGNILNLCAVSLPCGFTADGLPIGLMLYAKPFAEAALLRVAWAFEQATEWHARQPDLGWASSSAG